MMFRHLLRQRDVLNNPTVEMDILAMAGDFDEQRPPRREDDMPMHRRRGASSTTHKDVLQEAEGADQKDRSAAHSDASPIPIARDLPESPTEDGRHAPTCESRAWRHIHVADVAMHRRVVYVSAAWAASRVSQISVTIVLPTNDSDKARKAV